MGALAAPIKERKHDEPFRVWVAGCGAAKRSIRLQFASTKSWMALGREHNCNCSAPISARRLCNGRAKEFMEKRCFRSIARAAHRYFVKVDGEYQIIKSIRESCVFARHDLTIDPPFSRLDLISCRNVLIYMGAVLQSRILPMFHYGLKPSGVLMLGSAEAVPSSSELFIPINKEYKIYRKNAVPGGGPTLPPMVRRGRPSRPHACR